MDSGEEGIFGREISKYISIFGLWKRFVRVWVMGSEVGKVVGRRLNCSIFK